MSAASPSPRSRTEPMVFTPDEFRRGVMRAWSMFLLLLLAAEVATAVVSDLSYVERTGVGHVSSIAILPVVLLMSLLIGGVISGLSLLIGVPAAHRIAKALRREARLAVHVAVYAGFGFAFGAVIGGAAYAVASASVAASLLPAIFAALIAGVLSSAAVVFAWWTVARDALRAHRQPRQWRRAPTDRDADYEDSL